MRVSTTRFGELEVAKNDIITFNEGILGFEGLKQFFVVDPGDNTLILWLQSTEDEKIAFPIIEPQIFNPQYSAKLLPADMNSVELTDLSDARIYCILTIPADIKEMSANMKAPIVINNAKRLAKQVVLQDSKLSVKFSMYKELKKYIVNYSSDDTRRTRVNTPQTDKTKAETVTESPIQTHTSKENTPEA